MGKLMLKIALVILGVLTGFLAWFMLPVYQGAVVYFGGTTTTLGYGFIAIFCCGAAGFMYIKPKKPFWKMFCFYLMFFSMLSAVQCFYPVWFFTRWFV